MDRLDRLCFSILLRMLGAGASVIVALMGGCAFPYIKGRTQAWRQWAVVFGSICNAPSPHGAKEAAADLLMTAELPGHRLDQLCFSSF